MPTKSAFSEKLGGAPHSKQSLRLWLRLLSCSMIVEKRIRLLLEKEFATTLPRFDAMAALEREPDGLTMSQLSSAMMVSNGNVTGVINKLIEEMLVVRTSESEDKRVATIRLTRKGREAFKVMAKAHEGWVDRMFSDLSDSQIEQLMTLLAAARRSIGNNQI